MLNLSLQGSQISLSRQSSSSYRNVPAADEKLHSGRTKTPSVKSGRQKLSGQLFEAGNTRLCVDAPNNSSGIQRKEQVRKSFSDNVIARSQQNVNDWLDACGQKIVDDLEEIDAASLDVESVVSLIVDKNGNKRSDHPGLKLFLDSLDLVEDEHNQDLQRKTPKPHFEPVECQQEMNTSGDVSTELVSGQAFYGTESGIKQITSRENKFPKDEIEDMIKEVEAAQAIQRFWRRQKRKRLAAQAALIRMMAEQKHRLKERQITPGMPLQAAIVRREKSQQKRRMEQHKHCAQALQEKRENRQSEEQRPCAIFTDPDGAMKCATPKSSCNSVLAEQPNSPMETSEGISARKEGVSQVEHLVEDINNPEVLGYCPDEVKYEEQSEEPAPVRNDLQCSLQVVEPSACSGRTNIQELLNDVRNLGDLDAENRYICERSLENGRFNSGVSDAAHSDLCMRKEVWSEMLDEIHRVLSESDEPATLDLVYWPTSYSHHPATTTKTTTEIFKPNLPGNFNHQSYSGASPHWNRDATLPLTEQNLKQYSKNLNESKKRGDARRSAETFVQQSRDEMRKLAQSDGLRGSVVYPTGSHRPTSSAKQDKADSIRTMGPVQAVQHAANFCPSSSEELIQGQYYFDAEMTVRSLTAQLEEKTRSVQRLQRALEQQRELSVRQLRNTQREVDQRMEAAKTDYEATIGRNYKLIDELIEEKKVLHSKYEGLMSELKVAVQKAEEKLKVVEDRHKVELRKVEAKVHATEKLRREKWETEKVKQIKDSTMRAMETEIASLIASHKKELRQLRDACNEQIQAADSRAYEAYTGQVEELRQTLSREKEDACAREREEANKRLEKTLKDERAALEIQRRRLLLEISDERERLALTARRDREELDRKRQQLEESLTNAEAKYASELKKQIDELMERHEKEKAEMQERNLVERQAWEEHLKSVLEAQYLVRENALRDQLKRERDRQLESAVQRLEEEINGIRDEAEREAEAKIKRVRDKLTTEIVELERSEKHAMEKYREMKTKLLDKEHECERYQISGKQKEEEITEIRAQYEKLSKERQNISDIVRQEFADRLVLAEEENRTLKRDAAELRARLMNEQGKHEAELNAVKHSTQAELETLHQKIKEAVIKKEEKIKALKQQFEKQLAVQLSEVESANQRAAHLEEMLDQQRQQFLQAKR